MTLTPSAASRSQGSTGQPPGVIHADSIHRLFGRRIALPNTGSQLRQQRRRSGMRTRCITGAMSAVLGGFLVVSALLIARGAGASGTAVTRLAFAFALGTVAPWFAGPSLNEVADRRLGVGLSDLRW